jgi:hypothetical protein
VSGLEARARAGSTGPHLGELQTLSEAAEHLLQRHLEVVSEVGATLAAPAPSALASAAAKSLAEQVLEEVLETAEVAVVGAETAGATRAATLVAEAVVLGTFLVVRQDRVGLRNLLEALFRRRVVRVPVWVALHRELAIGLLEIGRARVTRATQHFVIVTLGQETAPTEGDVRKQPGIRREPCVRPKKRAGEARHECTGRNPPG